MKETLKLGLTLFIITAIAALILAVSHDITEKKVVADAEANVEDRIEAEVLDMAVEFKDLDEAEVEEISGPAGNIIEICEGYNDSELVGYTFIANTQGFGGAIKFLMGISVEGEITGLRILSHDETPGIGSHIAEPNFYEAFVGMSVDEEIVSDRQAEGDNEIQAITGATFSTDGVVDGVNRIRQIYNEKLSN